MKIAGQNPSFLATVADKAKTLWRHRCEFVWAYHTVTAFHSSLPVRVRIGGREYVGSMCGCGLGLNGQ